MSGLSRLAVRFPGSGARGLSADVTQVGRAHQAGVTVGCLVGHSGELWPPGLPGAGRRPARVAMALPAPGRGVSPRPASPPGRPAPARGAADPRGAAVAACLARAVIRVRGGTDALARAPQPLAGRGRPERRTSARRAPGGCHRRVR